MPDFGVKKCEFIGSLHFRFDILSGLDTDLFME